MFDYIANPRMSERAFVYEKGKEGPQLLPEYSADQSMLNTASGEGKFQKIDVPGVPDVVLFAPSELDEKVVKSRLDEVGPLALHLRQDTVAQKRSVAITELLQAALIAPAALLAFGFLVSWVLAGFRRRPSA